MFASSTWRTLPTAQAIYWPSGLNRATLTVPLKLKWCSSTLRRLLMSRERPSTSIASSRPPSGLRQSVRICPTTPVSQHRVPHIFIKLWYMKLECTSS